MTRQPQPENAEAVSSGKVRKMNSINKNTAYSMRYFIFFKIDMKTVGA